MTNSAAVVELKEENVIKEGAKESKLAVLSKEFRALHVQIVVADTECLRHAIQAGELVLTARRLVPHGDWSGWVTKHLGVHPRTALNYLAVFQAHKAGRLNDVTTLSGAYRAVSHSSGRQGKTKSRGRISFETCGIKAIEKHIEGLASESEVAFIKIALDRATSASACVTEALKKHKKRLFAGNVTVISLQVPQRATAAK